MEIKEKGLAKSKPQSNVSVNKRQNDVLLEKYRPKLLVTKDDFYNTCLTLLSMNKENLKDIMSNSATPMWVLNLSTAIMNETRAGKINVLLDILDRTYGKVSEIITYNEQNEAVIKLFSLIDTAEKQEILQCVIAMLATEEGLATLKILLKDFLQ
jgi:hypothetical protein